MSTNAAAITFRMHRVRNNKAAIRGWPGRAPAFCFLLAVSILSTIDLVNGQIPALAPTTDATIVVPIGVLRYSTIQIPTGVTVRFVAPGFGGLSVTGMPALVICDGDAIVHGTLWLAGDPINDRPAGWVLTGQGAPGFQCVGGGFFQPAEGGRHAGTYGSVLPFSLDGGSPGGDRRNYSDANCFQFASRDTGGEGGGILALLAGGRIEIHGTVTADGFSGVSGGSGGSILLRGDGGVTIHPTGVVTALGATAPLAAFPYPPQMGFGAPGYIRLDTWGALPVVQGTVTPTPTVLELPHLRTLSPPRIGTTWTFDIFTPEASVVFAAASPIQGNGASTPFGPLGIDLPSATILTYAAVAPTGHDPFVTAQTPVPNTPPLVGLTFWVQALVVPPALPARLSNTLPVTVQ